ncbi:MAG: polysaccharide pyruvyl transferase family protein [Planctomycetes bacterium]|nr:polysaccharide pyruvyl transferase family protein [Planctomycetota bacterium]
MPRLQLADNPSVFADTCDVADPCPLRVAIFGAMPGTGDLGVTALHLSLLDGIARRARTPVITIFDDDPGCASDTVRVAGGDLIYVRCGAIPTRRIYHPDSLFRIRASRRLGSFGSSAVHMLCSADAVLDVSAGEGFTDIHDEKHFSRSLREMRLVVDQGCPLILAPQAIGPFRDDRARRAATRILHAAAVVWTRDRQSHDLLVEMLGDAYDPSRHRRGVDLAYRLDATEPSTLPDRLKAWLAPDATTRVAGINVSGLLLNDYGDVVRRLVGRLLDETDTNVLLVPHVTTTPGDGEHDPDACDAVARAFADRAGDRVAVLPASVDPRDVKWVIGRTSWFCGARLHAVIAALSSGVPAAALVHAPWGRGALESSGLDVCVTDLAALDTNEIVERVWTSWCERDETRRRLAGALPEVVARAEGQMDEIVAFCLACRHLRLTRPHAA